jgi:hypothetical protein
VRFDGGLGAEGEAGGAVAQRAVLNHIYIGMKLGRWMIRVLERKMMSCDEGVIIVVEETQD